MAALFLTKIFFVNIVPANMYVSTLVAKLHCAVCTIRQNFSMSELFHPKFCVLKAAHFDKKIFLKVGLSKPKRPMLKKGYVTAAKYYSSLFFSKALQ